MTHEGRISISKTDFREILRHLTHAAIVLGSMPQQSCIGRAGTIRRLAAKLTSKIDQ